MNADMIVNWVREHADRDGFLNDGDLDAVAAAFGGEVWETGGGIRVAVIPVGPGNVVGVGEESTCLYEDANGSKEPYDIFWDNQGRMLWPKEG